MNCKVTERIELKNQAQGPEFIALCLQDMNRWLRLSQEATRLLMREQGLDDPDRLIVLTDKNNDEIYNIVRKPGGKNANIMPDRRQQILVLAQENLKLTIFLFYHK